MSELPTTTEVLPFSPQSSSAAEVLDRMRQHHGLTAPAAEAPFDQMNGVDASEVEPLLNLHQVQIKHEQGQSYTPFPETAVTPTTLLHIYPKIEGNRQQISHTTR